GRPDDAQPEDRARGSARRERARLDGAALDHVAVHRRGRRPPGGRRPHARPAARWRRLMARRYRAAYRAGRDRALVALLRGARSMLVALGLERGLRLADRVGALVPRILPEVRELSLEHLALALPELGRDAHERLGRDMFPGHTRSVIEIVRMADLAARIDDVVSTEGVEILDEALAAGRGVIAVTGHIGNWELLAAYFGMHGYPVTVIATPVKGERLNAENI